MKGCLFRDRKGREKVVFGVGCSQGGEWEGGRGGQLQQKAQAWTQKSTPGQQLQRTLVPSSISSARRDSAFVSDVGVFFCPAVLLSCLSVDSHLVSRPRTTTMTRGSAPHHEVHL